RVLVTGAAGTVGQELVSQLLTFGPAEIRALDNNESALFLMNEDYRSRSDFNAYLGDIRDAPKMGSLARGVDMIFHCAAFKHVFFSEYNPFEAVRTNIIGVQNIIQAALGNGVKKVIFTSSDKAVNPTTVMGTSKLMGERLITAANVINQNARQQVSSVRFGNVMGSRGSVIPIFHDQIKKGGPVTVTDPGMTRFIMTIARAAELVLKGALLARGGEVMVTKMRVISIMDLAEVMIELLAPYYGHSPASVALEFIGAKPGEKMYEELMTPDEVPRSLELADMFVVLPAARGIYRNIDYSYPGDTGKRANRPYISSEEPAMSKKEVRDFLISSRLLPPELLPESRKMEPVPCVS
ncbi:MAG: polysaccharide biosynthesis protein, partial [Deltaproteobacteria bacterium]|nr:polysaccharide biosynthesis protein [Deltaproteobacteria bacterium]